MAVTQRMAEHCIAVYTALEEQSTNGVFRGSISKLYDSCGISRAHYRKVWSLLVDLGCITREIDSPLGIGATKASIVRLNRCPTVEEFAAAYLHPGVHSDSVLLESRITALERRIGELNIVSVLGELTRKFKELEAQVAEIQNATPR